MTDTPRPPSLVAQYVREKIASLHNLGAVPNSCEIAAAAIWAAADRLVIPGNCDQLLRHAFIALSRELRCGLIPDASREALAEQFPALQPAPQQSTAEPTPASERPWERPGWCDSEGRCWGFNVNERSWSLKKATWLRKAHVIKWGWRWLLPANAIQIPFEESQS